MSERTRVSGRKDIEEGDDHDQSQDVLSKLQAGIYEDLDELANLLPYAADEPSLYGRSFPVDLCVGAVVLRSTTLKHVQNHGISGTFTILNGLYIPIPYHTTPIIIIIVYNSNKH